MPSAPGRLVDLTHHTPLLGEAFGGGTGPVDVGVTRYPKSQSRFIPSQKVRGKLHRVRGSWTPQTSPGEYPGPLLLELGERLAGLASG